MTRYHYDITLGENGVAVKKWLDLTDDPHHLALCLMLTTHLFKLFRRK